PALVHTTPLIDTRGMQTGWMSSVVDISDQKQAEERARQQQERLQTTVSCWAACRPCPIGPRRKRKPPRP
ncbi:hypothetical protein OZK63_41430, partial [Streptomyces sp. UMAF16]|nr:hypothetical protein [Streptomyces sp. UMAF16]